MAVWLYHKRLGAKLFESEEEIKEAKRWGWRESPQEAEKFTYPRKEDAFSIVEELLFTERGLSQSHWLERMGYDIGYKQVYKDLNVWWQEIEEMMKKRDDVIYYKQRYFHKENEYVRDLPVLQNEREKKGQSK